MLTWCKQEGSVGNTRLLPHANTLFVPMNCFLWRVDYALEEDFLAEQMWIFSAYFIPERSWHLYWFSTSFKCKALHCGWLRVLGCLISPKCLLDLNNAKPFSSCPWMSLFPAKFCYAGPSSLAFLGGWLSFWRIVIHGRPNDNFWKISVRKTIWDLEFSEHFC